MRLNETVYLMGFMTDIPLSTAIEAHSNVSFSPEKRGAAQVEEYARTLAHDFGDLRSLADTDEKVALLAGEFERYRQGYKARTLAYLHSRSRVMSPMITGPANFPVAANEKRSRWAHNKLNDLVGYRERALASIKKKLKPPTRPVMAGDEDAVERLEALLAAAMEEQETMKLTNAAIRKRLRAKGTKTDAEQHAALMEDLQALDHSEETAARLLKPDALYGIGYPEFKIRNNGTNIRRMQKRLQGLEKAKAAPVQEGQGKAARVEVNPGDNRVRLFFPGKPADDLRKRLKSSGFRWTPSLGAWQAYNNPRTQAIAADIANLEGAENG